MLENIINEICVENDETIKKLESLGITVRDSEGNLKELWDILQELAELVFLDGS